MNIFPLFLKEIWDEWNLRGAVLVSLFFQILLIFCASSRKRTGNMIMTFIIWSVYLLADWVAAFAVGLIANGNKDGDKQVQSDDLLAFWAPFLLLHLGGPDTITAFALEDNELWLRHLLGLVIQFIAVAYVFLESISNDLWIPTILMLVAGTIKYAERTRALYLACLGNFKESMLPAPDAGPNYAQLMEEFSSKEEAHVPVKIIIAPEKRASHSAPSVREEPSTGPNHISEMESGYKFFKIFKGLIVDLMFSFQERNDSRKFFFEMLPEKAFRVIEVELNFMYDALYTKMVVVNRKIGYFLRFICTGCIAVALQLFSSHHKHKIHKFDIGVTYALLIGAISLDVIAIVKLIFSDWTIVLLKNLTAKEWIYYAREKLFFYKLCEPSKSFFDRRWSNSISQHGLIRYCLRERFKWFDKLADICGLKDLLDEIQYKETVTVEEKLKEFIFKQLNKKAKSSEQLEEKAKSAEEKARRAEQSRIAKEICSGRGDWILSQYACHSLLWSVEKEYDECLLMWHIATDLCYYKDMQEEGKKPDDVKDRRKWCRFLSEYMLYLLVMQPTMMSAVAGIGQIRFRDTCAEAKKFFRRGQQEQNCFNKFCEQIKKLLCIGQSKPTDDQISKYCQKLLSVDTVVKPIDVKGDRSKSVLFDACMLAKDLGKLNKRKRWKIMSKVWVELLSYAASHCRANTHAQQLSKGGELITFVWLLMAHFGLGEQFRIQEGHARAKLIVTK
ncbi:uncharacterized protein LOC117909178 [Vitis riparia]|uniref:uncharacterized protein LOC117909178 n=1 Tax=Vitis riparia TaxID=96939 RepID=UPI00155B174E|nr:uncharacterized protein LOC117909178 [Vitis riparia]XP_034678980.1 uncharacterized protein LOC117909178 [Vitis riparia]